MKTLKESRTRITYARLDGSVVVAITGRAAAEESEDGAGAGARARGHGEARGAARRVGWATRPLRP